MDVFIAQVRYYDGLTRYAVFDGTGVLTGSLFPTADDARAFESMLQSTTFPWRRF